MARTNLGPVSLDICEIETILERIKEYVVSRTPSQIVTLNSLMFNIALRDEAYLRVISGSSLIIPESSGIVWASKFLNKPIYGHLAGIDVLGCICSACADNAFSIYLLGAKPGVAESAADNLRRLYPGLKICGVHHGYFTADEEDKITAHIAELSPDILFVGFDMPKQEFWIAKNLSRLKVPVVMGVGGSFDVLSGKLKRAPLWLRRLWLEWFFRFLQQPWRIKRLAGLPVFILSIVRIKLTSFHFQVKSDH